MPFSWLTSRARHALEHAIADDEAREPCRPAARQRCGQARRARRNGTAALAARGRDHGTLVVHPLAAPELSAALARRMPRGFRDRTEGMRALFGGLLPHDVLARESKAGFDEAFFHRHSRGFAATWDGDGVPEQFVDVEARRREWRAGAPAAQSFTRLQLAWLAREARAEGSARELLQEPLGGGREGAPATGPAHLHER